MNILLKRHSTRRTMKIDARHVWRLEVLALVHRPLERAADAVREATQECGLRRLDAVKVLVGHLSVVDQALLGRWALPPTRHLLRRRGHDDSKHGRDLSRITVLQRLGIDSKNAFSSYLFLQCPMVPFLQFPRWQLPQCWNRINRSSNARERRQILQFSRRIITPEWIRKQPTDGREKEKSLIIGNIAQARADRCNP